MPSTIELNDTECAAPIELLTAEIENTRYPLSPRTKALRAILDNLAPPPPRPEPFPAPKPRGQPSAVLAKKKRGPR